MEIRKKPIIKTERLIIKPYAPEDRERLVEFMTNEEITKTFMVPDYPTKEEFLNLADKLIGFSQLDDVKHLDSGVYLDGTLIGFVNDCGHNDEIIEIGYVIHPDYKGHGYASEAVRAVIEDLFEMGFKTVKAGFFEENPASRRVMEKCGMTLTDEVDEDEYRGKTHKCFYCEIQRP